MKYILVFSERLRKIIGCFILSKVGTYVWSYTLDRNNISVKNLDAVGVSPKFLLATDIFTIIPNNNHTTFKVREV